MMDLDRILEATFPAPRRQPCAGCGSAREFALGLLAYEAEHASGTQTPTLVAVANDLLEIVGRDDAEPTPA